MRSFLLLLLSVLPVVVRAQVRAADRSPVTFVYKLHHDEAVRIFDPASEPLLFDSTWLHTLADTFHGPKITRTLPAGAYLFVSAIKESLVVEPRLVTPLRFQAYDLRHGIAFSVTDTFGHEITDATVYFNGKRVAFDSVLQAYRVPKSKNGGFVHVQRGEAMLFYSADKLYAGNFWNSNGFGKVVSAPVRWVNNVIEDIRKGGDYRRSRYYREERTHPLGYIAFSKSKYRPGDTLRLEIWATNRKGKPLRSPLQLEIEPKRGRNTVVSTVVKSSSPGAYLFEMPLGDSLILDESYQVSVYDQRKDPDKYYPLEASFWYADYQLDEIKYSIEAEKHIFRRHNPVVLGVFGEDATGQPAVGISYEVVLTTRESGPYYATEVWVPDTLWTGSGILSADTATITLPDSIWPEAYLSVEAQVVFADSRGEIQTKEIVFVVDRKPQPYATELKNGILSISRQRNPNVPPDTVALAIRFPNISEPMIQTVVLPFRDTLNLAASEYEIWENGPDGLQWAHTVKLPDDVVSISPCRLDFDSVGFRMVNPQGVPVRYRILHQKHVLKEGFTNLTQLEHTLPQQAGEQVVIELAWTWKGKPQTTSTSLPAYPNRYWVDIDQPQTVKPGAREQVRIRVRDAKGKPVPNAHLTSGAYNALLGPALPSGLPKIKYNNLDYLYNTTRFVFKPVTPFGFRRALDQGWYKRLQLDELLYYRLRLKNTGGYAEILPVPLENLHVESLNRSLPQPEDSFYRFRPQFAVHVRRYGILEPVHLVYANKKIVYYSGVSNLPPYAFYGNIGWNQLIVRTADAEYTLDSIYLASGEKKELVVDANRWQQAPFRVQKTPMADTLSKQEKELLQQRLLLWRPSNADRVHFFWESADNIRRIPPAKGKQVQVVGPFPPNRDVWIMQQSGFVRMFQFEPGFEYDLQPERERLYTPSKNWLPSSFSKEIKAAAVGEFALGPQHVRLNRPEKNTIKYASPGQKTRGTATFHLNLPTGLSSRGWILQGIDTLIGPFSGATSYVQGLPAGTYGLQVFTSSDTILLDTVLLRADTLAYLRVNPYTMNKAIGGPMFIRFFGHEHYGEHPFETIGFHTSNTKNLGILQGTITELDSGEPLIGATVKVTRNGFFLTGTITDYEGQYRIRVPAGSCDIEVSYTGYLSQFTREVEIQKLRTTIVDVIMEGYGLQEVIITQYKVPLIEPDRTSGGSTLTSEQIRSLPMLTSKISGVTSDESIKNMSDDLIPNGEPTPDILRTHFNDVAYWQPNLRTDKNGEAVFQVTYPDDLTTWNTYALATGKKWHGGWTREFVVSKKQLSAQLAVPRFAIAGDRFTGVGLATNRTGDSLYLRSEFALNDKILNSSVFHYGLAKNDTVTIQVPDDLDSLQITYMLSSRLFSDAEQREVPVFKKGIQENIGQFWVLTNDTAFVYNPDPGAGTVRILALDNTLDLLLKDVQKLKSYPYDCNEQRASRLMALLAEKQLLSLGGKSYKDEKMLVENLRLLQKAQNNDGSWGWWPSGVSNAWMTSYVVGALGQAEKMGYDSKYNIERGLRWLRNVLPSLKPQEQYNVLDRLIAFNVKVDLNPYLKTYDTLPVRTLHDRLSRWHLGLAAGRTLNKDSLLNILKPTALGGLYAGEVGMDWYNNHAQNTLLAYEIAQTAGWDDVCRRIRLFWLEQHQKTGGLSTHETARIIGHLMPHLGDVSIGEHQLTIQDHSIKKYPADVRLRPAAPVRIAYQGKSPVFISASQSTWQSAPEQVEKPFAVSTHMKQHGENVQVLQRLSAAELVVEVQCDVAGQYVFIDVPIPAGCSYGPLANRNPHETHREQFRNRTGIFCEQLPVGKHTFRIPLEVRFSGSYTLNPARVEMMYFPVVYGRNAVGRVEVR